MLKSIKRLLLVGLGLSTFTAASLLTGTYKPDFKTSNQASSISISIGGEPALANWCPETARKETINGDFHVIAHANKCGEYYTYMSPAAGNYLKWQLNKARSSGTLISLGSLVTNYFPVGGRVTAYYTWRLDNVINNLEYCSSQNKGMWLNTNSYYVWSDMRVSCN
jgi:hypothetical protein